MTAFRNWLGKGLPRLIGAMVMIPAACTVLWLLEPRFALAIAPLFAVTLAGAGPRRATARAAAPPPARPPRAHRRRDGRTHAARARA